MVCSTISSSFGATALIFCRPDKPCSLYAASMKKMIQVQLPVILRIFEENQNPVGGDSRTNHVSISEKKIDKVNKTINNL
jgi:hypothetical protein